MAAAAAAASRVGEGAATTTTSTSSSSSWFLPDTSPRETVIAALAAAAAAGRGGVPTRDADTLRAPEFYNAHLSRALPVLIRGLMRRQEWSALEKFKDLAWLRDNHGGACVPVEIGRRRSDGAKGLSRYMLLGDFIAQYLSSSSSSSSSPRGDDGGSGGVGSGAGVEAGDCDEPGGDGGGGGGSEAPVVAYVSQHSLLHQEPGLQECFSVPEHTMGRLAAANAWLGTAVGSHAQVELG